MSSVFHRQLGSKPVAVRRGDGVYVTDENGVRYLDASSGGVVVSALGHSHPDVIGAIEQQLGRIAYFHGSIFTTDVLEDLAAELAAHAPAGLTKTFFVSGGSEAVETAIMLARQFAVETGQARRRQVIARRNSYHGATLYDITVGFNVVRRAPFLGMIPEMTHISPCYEYRGRDLDETEEAYGERVANELDEAIQRLGPKNALAFLAETVGGTSIGAAPPVPGYFKRIREICDRNGILLILDEVLCGLGRTGTLHACEQEGIAPDLMTLAKGLGAGYQPIGAVLVSERIHSAIESGSGGFRGGFTFSGHATACAAALAVQRVIRRDKLVDNVAAQGARLRQALIARFGNHHHVGDIRGRGLLQCIELVEDRMSKTPFQAPRAISARIGQEAMARGLLCCPASGAIDGHRGDHVLIAPPFIVEASQIDEIVERLGEAVDAALGTRGKTRPAIQSAIQ